MPPPSKSKSARAAFCIVILKGMWPVAAKIQDFKRNGGWNARKYWKYQLPSFELTDIFSHGYTIFIPSIFLQKQAFPNHNWGGPVKFLVRTKVVPHRRLEKASGQRCSIALSWTTAFLHLAKRFSLHFWGWREAMLNVITYIYILSFNGSNRKTETYIAWLKRGLSDPGMYLAFKCFPSLWAINN